MCFKSENKLIPLIVKNCIKSVVDILVLKPTENDDNQNNILSILGESFVKIGNSSGFFIDSSGIVVTNHHSLIEKGLLYKIHYAGDFFDCEKIYQDELNDIAFLKIKNTKTIFPFLKLGDSNKIQLGETIIAIGNVLDEFEQTVSRGIISGLSRYVKMNSEHVEPQEYRGLIQTDAAINPGNSGGPLINLKGEVIGINTLSVQGAENIGLAIPINLTKKVLNDIKKFGKVKNISLGIKYILIDKKNQLIHKLPVEYGAFIIYGSSNLYKQPGVLKGGLADKNGIKEGDIILESNGKRITKQCNLQDILQNYTIGDIIHLKILRGDKEFEIKINLE